MPSPEADNPKSIQALINRKEVTLEKILVPIDFSDYASAAIDYATRIGKLAGTHIALLYVVEIPRHQLSSEVYSGSERIRSTLNDMETRAMDRLEALCNVIRTPGIGCTASVRVGIPYEEILSEAEKIAPDLIVLGGKGYSALARILLGSTAEQVVRFARCSVLVARHPPNQLPSSPAGNA
jgi:nucleotide-binding universal stress UspA family protein